MNKSLAARGCLVGLLVALCAAIACSRRHAPPPPDQVYTIRGFITGLPRPDRPASELTIRHEPVPQFVSKDGRVVGMDSMEMPFTPAQGVSLSGLNIDDPVEFTFEVRWKQSPYFQLTHISKLSRETKINVGKVQKPGS